MLILEDDATLSIDNFKDKFNEIVNNLDNKIDILKLGWCGNQCLHAYIINKNSVSKILSKIDDCNIIDGQIEKLNREGIITMKNIDNKYHNSEKQHWTSGLFHQIDGDSMQTEYLSNNIYN